MCGARSATTATGRRSALPETLRRDRGVGVDAGGGDNPSILERLDEVLNKPGERLGLDEEREPERDDEVENMKEVERCRAQSL